MLCHSFTLPCSMWSLSLFPATFETVLNIPIGRLLVFPGTSWVPVMCVPLVHSINSWLRFVVIVCQAFWKSTFLVLLKCILKTKFSFFLVGIWDASVQTCTKSKWVGLFRPVFRRDKFGGSWDLLYGTAPTCESPLLFQVRDEIFISAGRLPAIILRPGLRMNRWVLLVCHESSEGPSSCSLALYFVSSYVKIVLNQP